MRAVQITRFGGPEVIELVDVPEPEDQGRCGAGVGDDPVSGEPVHADAPAPLTLPSPGD